LELLENKALLELLDQMEPPEFKEPLDCRELLAMWEEREQPEITGLLVFKVLQVI
jgi:hypothetical protein